MNDDQRDKMIKVLAAAFDRAAATSPTAHDAALRIATALHQAGYKIEMRAQPKRGGHPMTVMTMNQCRITGVASGPRVLVGIDDPRRELSIGTIWGNSVDWDDPEDGSYGGYDRHGTFIPASAMVEIVRLRLATRMAIDLIASGSLIPEAERRRLSDNIRALLHAGRIDVEQGGH